MPTMSAATTTTTTARATPTTRATRRSDPMAVTYTRALQRDTHKQAVIASSAVETAQPLLVATSLVALLAVALAYEGRVRPLAPAGAAPPGAVFNLSTCTAATQLEIAPQPTPPAPPDRRA